MFHRPIDPGLRFEPCPPPAGAGLSDLERETVHLSLRDGIATTRSPGRIQRWSGHLFGLRPRTALADVRLEALRVFCVCYRTGRRDVPRAGADDGILPVETMIAAAMLIDCLSNRTIRRR